MSRRATVEFANQLDFIALDKPSAAQRMGELVWKHAQQLDEWPELGRPGVVEGTRELAVPQTPYVLIYRIRGRQVEIIRLMHGAQQRP